nr:MAG: hypothetical protein DIU56_17665 [Pseudomonadota bacterium]
MARMSCTAAVLLIAAAVVATPGAQSQQGSQETTTPTAATLPPLFPEQQPPTEQELGVSVYPASVFLTSYDAGRGQRFYLYGATVGFDEMVAYYRTLLRDRGTTVYDRPRVHIFEIGRYNERTMAFPPSVTVKDYTWGGSPGYLNPVPGAQPERFPTVIQIVPAPQGAASR